MTTAPWRSNLPPTSVLEECPSRVPPPLPTPSLRVGLPMGGAYRGAGMVFNESKSARREFEKTLWGAHIDGLRGTVGPPPDRVICLAVLVAHVAKLGVAIVELLESFVRCLGCSLHLPSTFDELAGPRLRSS